MCLFACLCLFYHLIFKYNKLKARCLNLILIAPELARLAEQAKEMAGTSSKKGKHHDAITSVRNRQEKNIEQLVDCINRFTNPFSEESEDLFNLVTKVVMPEKVKEDLCQQSVI